MTNLLLLINYKLIAIIRTFANMLPRLRYKHPALLCRLGAVKMLVALMLFYVLRQVIPSLTWAYSLGACAAFWRVKITFEAPPSFVIGHQPNTILRMSSIHIVQSTDITLQELCQLKSHAP